MIKKLLAFLLTVLMISGMAAVNVSAVVIKKPKMLFPRISTVNVAKGGTVTEIIDVKATQWQQLDYAVEDTSIAVCNWEVDNTCQVLCVNGVKPGKTSVKVLLYADKYKKKVLDTVSIPIVCTAAEIKCTDLNYDLNEKGGEQILFTLENGTSDAVEITIESVDPEIIEVYCGIFTGNKNKECGAMAYALKHGTTKFNVKYTNADRDSIFYGVKLATKTFTVTSHSQKTVTSAATYFSAGKKAVKCKSCGKTIETTTIAKKVLAVPTAKLTAAKKALKVKVNKVTGQTGFQIRYRIKGKSKWTTKTYTGKKTVTKTIKLKAKKNYQVQVRAMVKSGSKKAYSSWSKTYQKKTK